MFKKSISFVLVIGAVVLPSCHSSKHAGDKDKLPAVWQATPIVIDGDSKDWPSPYPTYDSKAMIAYATSNDDKYLYITVESGDDLTQLKLAEAGMVVYIDTGGGKAMECDIHYPLPDASGEPMDIPKAEKGQKVETLVLELSKKIKRQVKIGMDNATQFNVEGFPACNGGYSISQQTTCGIKVKAGIDEYKEFIWEAAIPFKVLYNKETISAADAGKPISVCFNIKGLKKHKEEGTDNSSAMNGSSMGNSSMGGGRGNMGSSRGAMQDPLQYLYESTKTWKYFSLAFH